jgi:rSAM/selenodomain-associated transferase 2
MQNSEELRSVAIIMPVHEEPDIASMLPVFLAQAPEELLVVEAGDERTRAAVESWLVRQRSAPLRLLGAPRGRAIQMNAGAAESSADILWFVHADTRLPIAAIDLVRQAISSGAVWGRFDVRLSGEALAFRVIEFLMNWRSAITGIATGDQAIFIRRDAFRHVGGYAQIPLMEDVDLSRRLKRLSAPYRVRTPVVTSSRRWEKNGIFRTILLMWALRFAFAVGVSPTVLARWYR